MARTIAPGTPAETKAQHFDVKMPDFSMLEKMGDAKINAGIKNAELYAEALITSESQKLYNQFKNDPIQLSNALGKLPKMLSDLPSEIQTEMQKKLLLNSVSLVTKAKDNQEKQDKRDYKTYALVNAAETNKSIADDYFNVLVNLTAPAEEKMPIYNDIYVQNRIRLNELSDLTDEDGKPLFTEKQRESMKMPKEASVAGFSQFIGRFELKDLQDWDKKYFQNKEKFKNDTLIDESTYSSMEDILKKRMQALKDTSIRQLHGQAFYDAANLITEPIQANIDRAKKYGVFPSNIIDKVAKASQKATSSTYAYDPTKRTSPGAFLQALNDFSDTIVATDWSIEGREQAISQAADTLLKLEALAKDTNMQPELVDKIKTIVYKALTDKQATETLEPIYSVIVDRFTMPEPIVKSMTDADLTERQQQVKEAMSLGVESKNAFAYAKKIANQNYEINMVGAMDSFISGDYATFQQQVANADVRYKRDLVSFMPFNSTQWDMWEKDVENGKDVVLEYMGKRYRFNGFNAQKPFTILY